MSHSAGAASARRRKFQAGEDFVAAPVDFPGHVLDIAGPDPVFPAGHPAFLDIAQQLIKPVQFEDILADADSLLRPQ